MSKDSDLEELSHHEFWDDRYAGQHVVVEDGQEPVIKSFEWFGDFQKLKGFFAKQLPSDTSCRVLHLGCGNSVRSPFESIRGHMSSR
jgi:hypothetical protein